MQCNIDIVFEYLSWNNTDEIQSAGIEMAEKIKNLSVLIMPIESKTIWENCAKVLASKKDEELQIYFFELFEWLKDMNWPGAYIIYDRLLNALSEDVLMICQQSLVLAKQTNDLAWEMALKDFCAEYTNLKYPR